jgi:sugar transferase EpsL
MWNRGAKRASDLLVSAFALIILSPFLLLMALLVRWRLGSPVFFLQERAGKDGLPFQLWKFRSMSNASDESGNLLPDEKRIPPFGAWLRSSSIDELPALWNVFRGEMSLVGPRPLLIRYLPRYSERQAQRHRVRPGITGWAQVNGRNAISWEEKFELDVWYVEHQSLMLDLKIILLTVLRIVQRSGIDHGSAPMPEFMGSRQAGQGE